MLHYSGGPRYKKSCQLFAQHNILDVSYDTMINNVLGLQWNYPVDVCLIACSSSSASLNTICVLSYSLNCIRVVLRLNEVSIVIVYHYIRRWLMRGNNSRMRISGWTVPICRPLGFRDGTLSHLCLIQYWLFILFQMSARTVFSATAFVIIRNTIINSRSSIILFFQLRLRLTPSLFL